MLGEFGMEKLYKVKDAAIGHGGSSRLEDEVVFNQQMEPLKVKQFVSRKAEVK